MRRSTSRSTGPNTAVREGAHDARVKQITLSKRISGALRGLSSAPVPVAALEPVQALEPEQACDLRVRWGSASSSVSVLPVSSASRASLALTSCPLQRASPLHPWQDLASPVPSLPALRPSRHRRRECSARRRRVPFRVQAGAPASTAPPVRSLRRHRGAAPAAVPPVAQPQRQDSPDGLASSSRRAARTRRATSRTVDGASRRPHRARTTAQVLRVHPQLALELRDICSARR